MKNIGLFLRSMFISNNMFSVINGLSKYNLSCWDMCTFLFFLFAKTEQKFSVSISTHLLEVTQNYEAVRWHNFCFQRFFPSVSNISSKVACFCFFLFHQSTPIYFCDTLSAPPLSSIINNIH